MGEEGAAGVLWSEDLGKDGWGRVAGYDETLSCTSLNVSMSVGKTSDDYLRRRWFTTKEARKNKRF